MPSEYSNCRYDLPSCPPSSGSTPLSLRPAIMSSFFWVHTIVATTCHHVLLLLGPHHCRYDLPSCPPSSGSTPLSLRPAIMSSFFWVHTIVATTCHHVLLLLGPHHSVCMRTCNVLLYASWGKPEQAVACVSDRWTGIWNGMFIVHSQT